MGTPRLLQGGGGQDPTPPSPPTGAVVSACLLERAGLPEDDARQAGERSVAATVGALTAVQGCELWKHPPGLEGEALSPAQEELVGRGFAGPVVDLDVALTEEQRRHCAGGLDEPQLRMIKAMVNPHTHLSR